MGMCRMPETFSVDRLEEMYHEAVQEKSLVKLHVVVDLFHMRGVSRGVFYNAAADALLVVGRKEIEEASCLS